MDQEKSRQNCGSVHTLMKPTMVLAASTQTLYRRCAFRKRSGTPTDIRGIGAHVWTFSVVSKKNAASRWSRMTCVSALREEVTCVFSFSSGLCSCIRSKNSL